jgi:hypothetical protein
LLYNLWQDRENLFGLFVELRLFRFIALAASNTHCGDAIRKLLQTKTSEYIVTFLHTARPRGNFFKNDYLYTFGRGDTATKLYLLYLKG